MTKYKYKYKLKYKALGMHYAGGKEWAPQLQMQGQNIIPNTNTNPSTKY